MNWWFDDMGRNNLSGVPNTSTPPILTDDRIIEFLLQNPQARIDFQELLPTMLPAERDRLNSLVAKNPRVLLGYPIDEQVIDDRFMAALNSSGFRDPNRRKR